MSGGNLTGVNNIDMSAYNGTLTVGGSGAVHLEYANNNSVAFVNGSGDLVTDNVFTYNGTTVTVGGTTDTTGSSDGALVVDGGVYIAKKTYIYDGGNNTTANYSGAGALAVEGGVAVNNNVAIASLDPTLGGSNTTPSFGTQGGAYIGKDLYVGTTATINGNLYVDGTIFVKGSELSGLDQITGSTGTFVNINSTGTITANNIVANSLTVNGQAAITTATIGNFANGTQITAGPAIGVGSVTNGYTTTYTISNLGVQSATAGTGIALSGSTGSVTITNIGVTSLNSTTGTITIAAGSGISVDSTSTPGTITIAGTYSNTDTLQTVTGRGNQTSNAIEITNSTDHGYGVGALVGSNSTASWSLYTAGGIGAYKNITAGGVVSAGDITAVDGSDTGSVDAFYAVNNMQAARTVSSISGNTPVTIDAWATATYTSAKYLVQIVDAGSAYVSEIMIMQIGGNAYISEYGIVNNNGDLGEFSITQSSGNLVLEYTPTSAGSMTIQVVRQSILTAVESFC